MVHECNRFKWKHSSCTIGFTSFDYYLAEIKTVTDYSPFGCELKGRNLKKTGVNKSFRFGFQGQEGDDEIKGDGNSVNYKYRMHDPRLGRFFAVDPLAGSYPWNSAYAFSENKVISCVELEGKESADAIGPPQMNIYLCVKAAEEIQSNLKNANNQKLGSFIILTVNSIEEGYQVLKDYLGDVKIDNLVIAAHGFCNKSGDGVLALNYCGDNTTVADFPRYSKEIGPVLPDTPIKRIMKNESEVTAEVNALDLTLGLVKDGGSVVISSCRAGRDDYLMKSVSSLAENKLVLYMNQDKSGYGHSEGLLVEVDNKMVLSRIEDFSGEECTGISLGWQQQKGFDKIKELKKIPSLTGGIVVSSQSYPAIKIEGSEVGPLQQNGDF